MATPQTSAASADNRNEHFQLALSAAQAGSWEWDLQSNENRWSDEVWLLYGLTPHSAPASYDSWLASVHPDEREAVAAQISRNVAAGEEFEAEWRVNLVGATRWLLSRGRPLRDQNQNVVRYIGIIIDISDRKALEHAAESRIDELQGILNALPIAVAYVDKDDRYLLANLMHQKLIGLSLADLCGKTIPEVIGAEAYARAAHWHDRVRRGERVSFENVMRLADGELHELNVTFVPDPDASGALRGFLIAVIDQTESRRANAELHFLRAELEQSGRRLIAQQTIAAVAHELNQPLNATATYAEAARRQLAQNAPAASIAESLDRIVREVQRAGDVLRDLMKSLQPASRATPVSRADLNTVALRSLEIFRSEHDAEAHCLQIALASAPLPIAIDPLLAEKVILNLLRNACQALNSAGPCGAGAAIRITTRSDYGMAVIEISDNGPGVPPKQANDLFQPFRSSRQGGIGMGLAVSASIAEMHGGRLWHEPRTPGASFCCALPLAE